MDVTSKFTLLIVEDDITLLEVMKESLTRNNYDVLMAESGFSAKQILSMRPIDLVISDIEMPNLNGIDLLEWIKSNKQIPVILMTGFSRILETKKAIDIGADDFLTKPFDIRDLLSKIKTLAAQKARNPSADEAIDQPSENDLDKEFCKVAIEDFVSEKETDYGIYIRISKSKYVKVAHKGGKLEQDRVAALKAKGVIYLYVRREDFSKVVGFTILLSKAISSSDIANEKRLRFMRYTGEVVLEQILVAGLNEQSFRASKEFIVNAIDMVTRDDDLGTTLEVLAQHSDHLYSHSVAVSMVSVMIAQEMGIRTAQTLFKIALGGLYHDVGKKEIPQEILNKPRHALTPEDIKLLESHVKRGKELLESLKNVPSDISQIVFEHHEDLLGQGYPRGLSGLRIHPLSQIVTVADIFCEYTLKENSNTVTIDAPAALLKMKSTYGDSINQMALNALQKIIGT